MFLRCSLLIRNSKRHRQRVNEKKETRQRSFISPDDRTNSYETLSRRKFLANFAIKWLAFDRAKVRLQAAKIGSRSQILNDVSMQILIYSLTSKIHSQLHSFIKLISMPANKKNLLKLPYTQSKLNRIWITRCALLLIMNSAREEKNFRFRFNLTSLFKCYSLRLSNGRNFTRNASNDKIVSSWSMRKLF